MIFSEAKPEMKAKDDKMLTLERYFESCRRDLSIFFGSVLLGSSPGRSALQSAK